MGRGRRGTVRRPYFHFNETEISVLFYIERVRPWAWHEKKTYCIAKELKKDFWKVQAACRSLYRKGFLDYDATHKCWKCQDGVRAIAVASCSSYVPDDEDTSWS